MSRTSSKHVSLFIIITIVLGVAFAAQPASALRVEFIPANSTAPLSFEFELDNSKIDPGGVFDFEAVIAFDLRVTSRVNGETYVWGTGDVLYFDGVIEGCQITDLTSNLRAIVDGYDVNTVQWIGPGIHEDGIHVMGMLIVATGDNVISADDGHWWGSYACSGCPADPNVVPEPATLFLLATGVLGLVAWRRKRLQ